MNNKTDKRELFSEELDIVGFEDTVVCIEKDVEE